MRVHELAKEYGIKSTEFVDTIQSFGHDIKSHLSSLDDIQVLDIREKIEKKEKEEEAAADQNVVDLPLSEQSLPITNVTVPGGEDGPRAYTDQDKKKLSKPKDLTQEEVDEVFDKDPEAFEEYCDDDKSETIDEKNERRHQEIAEENEKVLAREKEYRERVIAKTQKVIVENPTGFWAWLKGLFS